MAKIVRTRVRTLNVALPDPSGSGTNPPKGLVYEPGSRRLTVRYEKKSCRLPTPSGWYEHPLRGCSYAHGGPKGLPMCTGTEVPVKKKKNIFGLNYLKFKLNVRLKVDLGW